MALGFCVVLVLPIACDSTRGLDTPPQVRIQDITPFLDSFRGADHPGVDRFVQDYRVFHSLCEPGGAKSIRDSSQWTPSDLVLLALLIPSLWMIVSLKL